MGQGDLAMAGPRIRIQNNQIKDLYDPEDVLDAVNLQSMNAAIASVFQGSSTFEPFNFSSGGVISPSSFGSSQNDYNPTGFNNAFMVRLTPTASINITGMAATTNSKYGFKIIKNTNSTATITFVHNSGSSSAANRFSNFDGLDFKLGPLETCIVYYDATLQRWTVASHYTRLLQNFQELNTTGGNFMPYWSAFNTAALANFRQLTTSTYSGSITWTGTTAPSGSTNHTNGGLIIGNMFHGWIFLKYQSAGTALTAVSMRLGTNWPDPLEASGQTAASNILYPGVHIWMSSDTAALAGSGNRCFLQRDAGDTAWSIVSRESSAATKNVCVFISYPTA